MTITTRANKGVSLTFDEMDENFRDLRFDTDLDRVLSNGNTTTRDLSVGSLQYTTRKYLPGEVVQQLYFREGTINRYTALATGWSQGPLAFGQWFIEIPARATITPQFADSLIVCEWNIYGEPSAHDTGFKIAELDSGVPTIINRPGYEGYNAQTAVGERNHFISDFFDNNDDSTGRMSNFMYFDKPNTTSEITYTILFGANGNVGNAYTWNRAYGAGADYEECVSTWTIKEIKQ